MTKNNDFNNFLAGIILEYQAISQNEETKKKLREVFLAEIKKQKPDYINSEQAINELMITILQLEEIDFFTCFYQHIKEQKPEFKFSAKTIFLIAKHSIKYNESDKTIFFKKDNPDKYIHEFTKNYNDIYQLITDLNAEKKSQEQELTLNFKGGQYFYHLKSYSNNLIAESINLFLNEKILDGNNFSINEDDYLIFIKKNSIDEATIELCKINRISTANINKLLKSNTRKEILISWIINTEEEKEEKFKSIEWYIIENFNYNDFTLLLSKKIEQKNLIMDAIQISHINFFIKIWLFLRYFEFNKIYSLIVNSIIEQKTKPVSSDILDKAERSKPNNTKEKTRYIEEEEKIKNGLTDG